MVLLSRARAENIPPLNPSARDPFAALWLGKAAKPPASINNNQNDKNYQDNTDDTSIDDNCDNGDDEGEDEKVDQARRAPSERKRRENAAFELWLEKEQRAITAASASSLHDLTGSHSGIGSVLQDGVGKKIISSPREYQLDLFERAKERNTIVVLDTGSGKTLIAALLLRHVLEQELEHRACGEPHKMAFFVVEKVALCYQQHAVLTSNLQFPIVSFFGDMTGSVRTQEFWDKQFAENMAVVCTAQILLGLLDCSFIRIDRINLLIFDEAHHAKKNHPYARILRNHYLQEGPDKRPRIMGMTASPVDSKVDDVRLAAAELEAMMCSTIATVSDEVLWRGYAQRQQSEMRVEYTRLAEPEESRTELWTRVAEFVGENSHFRDHLQCAQQASSTLGGWCADRYWKLLMTGEEAAKLEARTGQDFAGYFDVTQGDEAVAAVQQTANIVRSWPLEAISRGSPLLSSKVQVLYDLLEDVFLRKEAKRCIVFVQARSTAFLLGDLFQQRGMLIHDVRAAYMTGSGSGSSTISSMSYRDQVLTLQKFRSGGTNCLFATSVAEEGIDIPECDVIIRFDLFSSAIQYIQSKGRARQKSSIYISMIEAGNVDHLRRVNQASRDSNSLRRFCSALPEDRKVQDYVIDGATIAQYARLSQKVCSIPETGARLTLISSLEVLAKFTSSLPGQHNAEYIVTSAAKKFIARIIFPSASPIKTAVGEPQRTKQLARCSAAFEACVELVKKEYIDAHLQPKFAKKLPTMRNARLALRSDKRSDYEMRLKPVFWSKGLGCSSSTVLFPSVLRLKNPEAVGRISRPLILLTRLPLPQVPLIPLFFGNGQKTWLRPEVSRVPLESTPDRLDLLANFTLRLFADIFSKEFAASQEELPYFLAPYSGQPTDNSAGDTRIDWALLKDIMATGELSWEDAQEDLFVNRLAIDPFDGSRKFILKGINRDLKPSDPTPKGVPAVKSLAYRKVEQTIQEYSNSLSFKSRRRMKWRQDQPVLNAELLSTRRNFLDEFLIEASPGGQCYVIPQPLRLSPLPLDVVSMALILPVIMYRIDNSLITLEACDQLGLAICPGLALEAMTKDSVNSGEHSEEALDFQSGMGKNYERLEFLGDTFLKMATSISVFTLFPAGDECEYHVERMLMLCNRNLFRHAVSEDRKLQESIRSKAFDRRAWYPDLRLMRGKASKTKAAHCLSDKSVADVCEALIGAAYMSHMSDENGILSRHGKELDVAVQAVTVMVNSENHGMRAFGDYFAAFAVPEWHKQPATAVQQLAVDAISKAVGYRFESAPLLRSAFKHPSYAFESIPDYQRLEFLGDALLDMVAVDFLFRRFPEADPQWLTEHKMAMVSNQFLGCLCVKLGLHRHILLATSALLGDINEYVAQLSCAEEAARLVGRTGEGGATTTPRMDFWTIAPQPPKALADVVEALVGAMFVDSQYDYGAVQRFFRTHMQAYFEDMSAHESLAGQHPVTALARRLQADFGCSRWSLHVASVPPPTSAGVAVLSESEVLCALTVHGAVLFHETAKSGGAAKLAVSKVAVSRFADWRADVFQAQTGCDCGDGRPSSWADGRRRP